MSLRPIRKGLFSRSHYSVFASGTVFCAVVGVWAATSVGYPQTIGINVHVLPRLPSSSVGSYFDPWTQAITIRVDVHHRYYLDSNLIQLNAIPSALSERFKRRANWSVYIEGNSDASYQDVMEAIDAVKAMRGNVILLGTR